MVNINNVYLTVQAILNKEQRGYVAPVEFNKFARQAQDEIFEAYFYDLAHFSLNRKGMSAGKPADIKKNIKEKIDIFSEISACTFADGRFSLPSDSYRLGSVYYTGMKQIEEIEKSMLQYVLSSRLTAPTTTFPKYVRLDDKLLIYPDTIVDSVTVHYIRQPKDPIWGYVSLGDGNVPTYNPSPLSSIDFELHPSERYLLVEKILLYSGIQIKEADIVQFAAQDESGDNQNKKQ